MFGLSNSIFSQDTLGISQVYIHNDLVYDMNGERFTGVAQKKRKNGQVKYDEVYKDGVILESNLYFKGEGQKLSYKIKYNRYKLWAKEKEYYYRKSGWHEITTFDENGRRVLVEEFEDEKLIYSCEYSGKKKNGKEFCYSDDGRELNFEYVNGKKIQRNNK